MSKRAKVNMFRWFVIEIITIIIATIHFFVSPQHRSYAIPAYIAVVIGLVLWVIVWCCLQAKQTK